MLRERIRLWLKRPLSEVVAVLGAVFAGLGVILACANVVTAVYAVITEQHAAELALAQTRPRFQITYRSPGPGAYVVVDKGYPAPGATCQLIPFVHVSSPKQGAGSGVFLPYPDYVSHHGLSGAESGTTSYPVTVPRRPVEALGPRLRQVEKGGLDATPCVLFDIHFVNVLGKDDRLVYYVDEDRFFPLSSQDADRVLQYAQLEKQGVSFTSAAADGDQQKAVAQLVRWWRQFAPKQDLSFLSRQIDAGDQLR